MSAFILCLCCPVYVATMRGADHPTRESCRLSIRFIFQNLLILNEHRPKGLIREARRRNKRTGKLNRAVKLFSGC
jgi:hypothetical protein